MNLLWLSFKNSSFNSCWHLVSSILTALSTCTVGCIACWLVSMIILDEIVFFISLFVCLWGWASGLCHLGICCSTKSRVRGHLRIYLGYFSPADDSESPTADSPTPPSLEVSACNCCYLVLSVLLADVLHLHLGTPWRPGAIRIGPICFQTIQTCLWFL